MDDLKNTDCLKTITISLPCWNEEKNIKDLVSEIEKQFLEFLPQYNYIIQFSDNCSTDSTRGILRDLCNANPHVRAIFNVANVSGSAIHSILQADGDCCIHMASDFQDPPELIPQLIEKWEQGAQVVCAIKTSGEEKKIMWNIRSLYYKIMCRFSSIPQIEHFTGFGLYDRKFIEIIRRIEDPIPTLRGYVAEFGHKVEKLYFRQPLRKSGKSGKNFIKNFDYAMKSFTTYTKVTIHITTIVGLLFTFVFFVLGILFLILKMVFHIYWINEAALLSILILLAISIQIFLTGLIGEYIVSINTRLLKRPLAIEAERIGIWDSRQQPKPDNNSPYIPFYPTDITK